MKHKDKFKQEYQSRRGRGGAHFFPLPLAAFFGAAFLAAFLAGALFGAAFLATFLAAFFGAALFGATFLAAIRNERLVRGC